MSDSQFQSNGTPGDDYSVLKSMGMQDDEITKVKEVDEAFLTKTMGESLKISYKYLSEISSPIQTDFSKYKIPDILEKCNFLKHGCGDGCTYICTYLVTAVNNCLSELQYPFPYIWDFNTTFFDYPQKKNSMCIGMLSGILCRYYKLEEAETLIESYLSSLSEYPDPTSQPIEFALFEDIITIYLNGCLINLYKFDKARAFTEKSPFFTVEVKKNLLTHIDQLESQVQHKNTVIPPKTHAEESNNKESNRNSNIIINNNNDKNQNHIHDRNRDAIATKSGSHSSSSSPSSSVSTKLVASVGSVASRFLRVIQKLFSGSTIRSIVSNKFKVIAVVLGVIFAYYYYVKSESKSKLISFYWNQLVDFLDIGFNMKNSIRRIKRNHANYNNPVNVIR